MTAAQEYNVKFFIMVNLTLIYHNQKARSVTLYNYCSNDPINRTDPTGMTDYVTENGKVIGNDGQKDDNIHIVTDRKEIKTIQQNHKKNTSTPLEKVKSGTMTTRTELTEALDVLARTEANGGKNEEASVVTPNGQVVRGQTANGESGTFPYVEGNNNTSIHSHPLNIEVTDGGITSYSATEPSKPPTVQNDVTAFKDYQRNIIVGFLGFARFGETPDKGAVIYDRNGDTQATLKKSAIIKILGK
jgi:hypothetical protein